MFHDTLLYDIELNLFNNFLYYTYKTQIAKSIGRAKLRLSALKYDDQPLQSPLSPEKKTFMKTSLVTLNSQFKYHEIYFETYSERNSFEQLWDCWINMWMNGKTSVLLKLKKKKNKPRQSYLNCAWCNESTIFS